MFTWNNYVDASIVKLQRCFEKSGVEYMTYQRETGEKGTKHLQGYICFFKKKKKSTIINLLIGAHVYSRRGTHSQAKAYCQKEKTRDEGSLNIELGSDVDIAEGKGERTDLKVIQSELKTKRYRDVLEENFSSFARYHKFFKEYSDTVRDEAYEEKVEHRFRSSVLKYWQVKVVEKLLEQDNRTILWVWEAEGNVGKTWLGQYLESIHGAFLCQLGKKADLAFAYDYQRIVAFDLTRSDKEFINYSLIESFKDGRLFSSKYESKIKKFPSCKVVVFSNYQPDYEKLSLDRLEVICIPKRDSRLFNLKIE